MSLSLTYFQRILWSVVLLLCASTSSSYAQMYDRFNGSSLAASRWEPVIITGKSISNELSVGTGYLHMSIRAAGDSTRTSGATTVSRTALRLPESRVVNLDGTNKLRALQSFVVVRSFKVQGCSLNGGAESQSRFVQTNSWFNDGRSSGPNDFTGDVFAELMVAQDSGRAPGTRASELQVRFDLRVCNNKACRQYDSLIADNSAIEPVLTKVRKGERISLRTSFNANKQIITFTAKAVGKKAVRRSLDLSTLTTIGGSMSTPRYAHSIQTRAEAADCNLSRGNVRQPLADIDVDLDYVRASFKRG